MIHLENHVWIPQTENDYNTIVWSYLFKRSFSDHEVRRLVLPYPPADGHRYREGELRSDVFFRVVPYLTGALETGGPQGRLRVQPGVLAALPPAQLACRYWMTKWFAPAELPGLLDSVITLTWEPLP